MKALKRILLSMFLICSLAVFWACDKKEDAKITEIYFKSGSVPTSVEQYSSWDTDDIVLVVRYSNGTERELNNFNCSGISTQTIGEQTLTATYEGFTCSTVITITQFTGERAYYIEEIYEPNTIGNVWAANSQKTNAYTAQLDKDAASKVKGFVDTGRTYKVGNDNPFKFSPSIQVVYFDESKSGETIHNYPIHADVYLDNQGTWQLISEQDLANYVAIDRDNHTFQFVNNTSVEGKKFKIEVRPDFDLLLDEHDEYLDYEQAIDATKNQFKAISFDFEVVDGYNVYTAKDLSVVDNSNDEGKWNAIKGTELINLSKTIKSVILHNNIVITTNDIPSIHFYEANDPEFGSIAGKMDNEDHYVARGIVYKRVIADGQSFNMEGNYFTISLDEHFPLITVPATSLEQTEVLTPSTTLFGFIDNYTEYRDFPEASQNDVEKGVADTNEETCTISNVSFMGNNNKNEQTARNEGGMTCYKTENVNFTIDNCLSQSWYIAHYLEGSSYSGENVTHIIKNCTSFDSYNTLIYMEGAKNVIIEDSYLIGAGGPVMICDEAQAWIDYNDDDEEDNGEVFKFKTNVLVKNSTLESWVVGTESWFDQMHAQALATQIKALDIDIKKPLEEQGLGLTITEATGQKMNIVAVYKSSKVTNPATYAKIDGKFSVEGFGYGLDFAYAELAAISGQHALQTFTGALVSADKKVMLPMNHSDMATAKAEFVGRIMAADKYVAAYLFNGMGAVFGASKSN